MHSRAFACMRMPRRRSSFPCVDPAFEGECEEKDCCWRKDVMHEGLGRGSHPRSFQESGGAHYKHLATAIRCVLSKTGPGTANNVLLLPNVVPLLLEVVVSTGALTLERP